MILGSMIGLILLKNTSWNLTKSVKFSVKSGRNPNIPSISCGASGSSLDNHSSARGASFGMYGRIFGRYGSNSGRYGCNCGR